LRSTEGYGSYWHASFVFARKANRFTTKRNAAYPKGHPAYPLSAEPCMKKGAPQHAFDRFHPVSVAYILG
jgi:hypothetical protein